MTKTDAQFPARLTLREEGFTEIPFSSLFETFSRPWLTSFSAFAYFFACLSNLAARR